MFLSYWIKDEIGEVRLVCKMQNLFFPALKVYTMIYFSSEYVVRYIKSNAPLQNLRSPHSIRMGNG